MHGECQKWITEFTERLRNAGPTAAVHYLVQIGVDNPAACSCHDWDKGGADALGWLHRNHREYNRTVFEVIKADIACIRRVLRADLHTPDQFFGESHNHGPYGRIVLKSYGQELLDNFVKAVPNPDWV